MAFVRLVTNAFVLFEISVLLCCTTTTTTVYGDATLANHLAPADAPIYLDTIPPPPPPHHHYHHHPPPPPYRRPHTPAPSPPPVKPPTYPPVKPPSHPPAKPPSASPPIYPPHRKLVAVQGVVFCKSCRFRGVDTLMGAAPLAGAVVKLQCNNTKYGLVEQTKTDQNGYFFFMPLKLSTAAFHKCKVFLVSSPMKTCNKPTNLHGGTSGALLIPTAKPPVTATPFQLFSVGPFAFEPHKKLKCHY